MPETPDNYELEPCLDETRLRAAARFAGKLTVLAAAITVSYAGIDLLENALGAELLDPEMQLAVATTTCTVALVTAGSRGAS